MRISQNPSPKNSPLIEYPIGSTVKYRRENGELLDLTVEDYDPLVNVFKLTGIDDDSPLEFNMTPQTLSERTISAEEMNLKFPIGATVGYTIRKMDKEGFVGKTITGEGTVYGFKDGRYIIQVGENLTPVKEENIYKLDSTPPHEVAKQIEENRTTLQEPFAQAKGK